jgi:hypothetical protein
MGVGTSFQPTRKTPPARPKFLTFSPRADGWDQAIRLTSRALTLRCGDGSSAAACAPVRDLPRRGPLRSIPPPSTEFRAWRSARCADFARSVEAPCPRPRLYRMTCARLA